MIEKLSSEQQAIIARHQSPNGADLRSLASKLGVGIYVSSTLPAMVDGKITYDKTLKKYVIFVNPTDNNTNRQRFTVAHELAHFLLHKDKIDSDTEYVDGIARDGSYSEIEQEANELAADILMPTDLLNKALDELPENLSRYSVASQLAEQFKVSLTAMSIRLGIPT